ncbi:MAG: ATP-binding protein, partial [Cyclobacteriaceae bacterium]|nr:ATP-binding protein [Cyclobacteriaceae bacterium]
TRLIRKKATSFSLNKRFYRKDKSLIWVSWNVSVIWDENQQPIYLAGIAIDISDEIKAKEQVKMALEELQMKNTTLKETQQQLLLSEKMASLGGLMAGIAHEINNPMNFISGGVQALRENISDISLTFQQLKEIETGIHSQKLHNQLDNIEPQVKILNKITGNIENGVSRTLAILKGLQIFTRSREDEIANVDIHENIDSTLIVLRNNYREVTEIKKDFGKLPPIDCNPGKLNQVFSNLITNSIYAINDKFQGKGLGIIYIKTRLDKSKKNVILEFGDNGKGVPQEIKQRIFEPFYTTKPMGKGTGLGLSLSFSIIKEHHGEMELLSKTLKHKGLNEKFTVFQLRLPINQSTL